MISSYEEKRKRNKIIKDENPIYSWSYLDRPITWRDEFKKSGFILLAINLSLLLIFIIPIITGDDYISILYFSLAFNIFFFLLLRFLVLANMLYEYDIKKSGIHCRYTQDIPEVCYQVARGIGWFGVLVCFIALFYIGPLAFFGMGASALLSFKQVNFRKEFQEKFVFFDDHMMIFDIVGNNKFYLTSNPDFTNNFLFGSEDKLSVIDRISDRIPLIDKYKLKKERDYTDHPVMTKLKEEYRQSVM